MSAFNKVYPQAAKLAKETLAEFRLHYEHGLDQDAVLVLGEVHLTVERADSLEQRIAEAIWKYHEEQK